MFSPSICHEVIESNAMIIVFFFWMLSFKPAFFTLFFHSYQEAFFSSSSIPPISGITYMSEVVDISPSNFDTSLWLIQPRISHDVSCIKVK